MESDSIITSVVFLFFQNSFFPLAGLESFCDWRMVYSPFFSDQSSSIISPTLPPSLLLTLFPTVPFADLKCIEDTLKATVDLHSGSDESVASLSLSAVENILKALKVSKSSRPSLVETAFRVEDRNSCDSGSLVAKDWKELTISLCSALSCLKECKLTNRTHLVKNHPLP